MGHEGPLAIRAAEAPLRARQSNYPPTLAARVSGRAKRPLGDLFGLTNFGVNLTRLAPGAASSLRHAHTRQDEFVYILEGCPTLHTDEGRRSLCPGMCAGFRAATGNAHALLNESEHDVVYLEIGDRSEGDEVGYPDDDLCSRFVGGRWVFRRKDGTPLPPPSDGPVPTGHGPQVGRPAAGCGAGDPPSPSVRRAADGAIDTRHYADRALRRRDRLLGRWLRRILGRAIGFWRRATVEAELNALDERALRDLGIARADIPGIADGTYLADDSRRQRGTPGR